MEPHDDPEARIRELERPLADIARAAELGTEPNDYGLPYTSGRRQMSAGLRPWRLVLVLIAAGLVMAGAGVAFFLVNTSVPTGLVKETPKIRTDVADGGSPLFDGVPLATSAAPGEQVSVQGVRQDSTIACDNCIVDVSGVSNTVTIIGHCVNLTVSGIKNSVNVESADAIDASGFDNRVIYQSGSPKIENSGGANLVKRG